MRQERLVFPDPIDNYESAVESLKILWMHGVRFGNPNSGVVCVKLPEPLQHDWGYYELIYTACRNVIGLHAMHAVFAMLKACDPSLHSGQARSDKEFSLALRKELENLEKIFHNAPPGPWDYEREDGFGPEHIWDANERPIASITWSYDRNEDGWEWVAHVLHIAREIASCLPGQDIATQHLYAVSNGYHGESAVHVLVIAPNEATALEKATECFKTASGPYGEPYYNHLTCTILCSDLTTTWTSEVEGE